MRREAYDVSPWRANQHGEETFFAERPGTYPDRQAASSARALIQAVDLYDAGLINAEELTPELVRLRPHETNEKIAVVRRGGAAVERR